MISRRGRNEGYALLDAMLAILIASIAAGAVFGALASVFGRSIHAYEKAQRMVESRNQSAVELMDAAP